eukprot:scaffold8337_cov16-Tisochrysis_lutea.AAC.1
MSSMSSLNIHALDIEHIPCMHEPHDMQEWFEARKAQLASMQAQGAQAAVPPGCVRLWVCPLTKKVFKTEHTYQAHTRSR